jgi:hypothetical protein
MQFLKPTKVLFHFTNAKYVESVGQHFDLNLPVLPTTKLSHKQTGLQTQNVWFGSKISSPVYPPLFATVHTLNYGVISPTAISAELEWS